MPQGKNEKELISVMEQLYGSFSSLTATGWNRFIYGEPYIAFEMAVHHIGEEIHFYSAVPKSYAEVFEKQVHGLFPNAQIEPAKDFNIFNGDGFSAGSYLTLKDNPMLPIKSYQSLFADPLGEISTSLSKLEKEGEGASIQILFKPAARKDIQDMAQKVAKEMQTGFKFSVAYERAKSPPKKDEKIENPGAVTPFEGELVKAIHGERSSRRTASERSDRVIRPVFSDRHEFI
jgi:hypothetical protein